MERCQVCGYTFNPTHRRRLEIMGESVEYCADNAECGEAAAHDYLIKVAASKMIGDEERSRLQETGELVVGPVTVGALVQALEDLGIDPMETTMPVGVQIKVVEV